MQARAPDAFTRACVFNAVVKVISLKRVARKLSSNDSVLPELKCTASFTVANAIVNRCYI